MRVRFLYSDHTVWEGLPEHAHRSPDPRPPAGGVIRMDVLHGKDGDLTMSFKYDDCYYSYLTDKGWLFGSGTPKREYLFRDDTGCDGIEIPLRLPANAVVRYGCTVSDEEAKKFGIYIPTLRPRKSVLVEHDHE